VVVFTNLSIFHVPYVAWCRVAACCREVSSPGERLCSASAAVVGFKVPSGLGERRAGFCPLVYHCTYLGFKAY